MYSGTPSPRLRLRLLAATAFALAAALPVTAVAAGSSQSPVGTWVTEGGKSHIEIYRCGAAMCGKVVWLDRAPGRGPALDKANPDPDKRGQPIIGLRVLSGLQPTDRPNVWDDGRVYDPRDGESYSVKMTLQPDGRLRVRGYLGISLLGRSQTWTRLE